MIKYVAIVVWVILSCACGKQAQVPERVCVDVSAVGKASDFFSDCRMLPLATTDSCIVSEVNKVVFAEDKVALLSQEQIFVFDTAGDFIGKINRRGNGAGEYMQVDDFCFRKESILVLSRNQKAILEYTLTGKFVKKRSLPAAYNHFKLLDSSILILASENNNDTGWNFSYYDWDENCIVANMGAFGQNEYFLLGGFDAFVGRGENVWVTYPFDYKIYALRDAALEPELSFSFNTKASLPEERHNLSYLNLYEQTANKPVVKYIQTYSEIGDMRYVVYPLFGETGIRTCLSKIHPDGSTRTLKIGDEMDEDFKYFAMGSYHGIYKDELVMVVYPATALMLEKDYGMDELANKLVKAEDNPILFFYKLKGK